MNTVTAAESQSLSITIIIVQQPEPCVVLTLVDRRRARHGCQSSVAGEVDAVCRSWTERDCCAVLPRLRHSDNHRPRGAISSITYHLTRTHRS